MRETAASMAMIASSQSAPLIRWPRTEATVRKSAMRQALLDPWKRKTLRIIRSKPTTRTNSFVLLIKVLGKNSCTSFNLIGMAGVIEERILITPRIKIITGAKMRRKILFLREIKLPIPAIRGSQNSKKR